MLKLIEADKKYLEQYKEAYLLSLKQIELGNIKKHDLMFMNPDEKDVLYEKNQENAEGRYAYYESLKTNK